MDKLFTDSPIPINNGLDQEQNRAAVLAIKKLKVHDLQTVISTVGIPIRRQNKIELQRQLYHALFESRYAHKIWNLVVFSQQQQMEMAKRVQPNQQRSQPYSLNGRNGASNQLVNHYHQQQQQMLQQHHQQFSSQQQQQAQTNQKFFADPFQIVTLPFYDVVANILAPVELHAAPNGSKQAKHASFQFPVPSDQMQKIAYRPETTPLPRYEVQLRFFNLTEPNGPQKDDFPLNCYVKVDDATVQLPNVIPTNKPNVEPKRPSRPVNITHYLNRVFQGSHRLHVEWLGDRRTWAAAICFVHRVNADILFERLDKNPSKRRTLEMTKNEVINKLKKNDDGIELEEIKISLLDPCIRTRMKTPARGAECTHLQCFDLLAFLMMNEKKPTWLCPVCARHCPYEKLMIEEYFVDMLANVDPEQCDIVLKDDGSYCVATDKDQVTLSDDDDDDVKLPMNPSKSDGEPKTESKKKAPIIVDDVITLSDDEDEALCRGSASASEPKGPKTPPRSNGNDSDIEIITLDDTPPRPPPQPVRQMSQQQNLSIPTPPLSAGPVPTPSSSMCNSIETYNAMSRMNGGGPPRTTPSSLMTQQLPQRPLNFPNYISVPHSAPSAPQPPTSQYGFSPLMMPQQSYQVQNGLIGRNNQMAHMQQQQMAQSPQGMMSPSYYGQSPMGNSAPIPPPRLLNGQEIQGISNQVSNSLRFSENSQTGVTVRKNRRDGAPN